VTGPAACLIGAGVLALGDWLAVARRWHRAEAVLKPLVLLALIAAAALGDVDHRVRPFLVVGLALGLVGDVALLRSKGDEPDGPFLTGLCAFLLGHVAYVAAFLRHGVHRLDLLAGALVVVGVAGLALPAVLRGALDKGGRELTVVVGIYALLLGAMAVTAAGTSAIATGIGGVLFLVSDSLLARARFAGRAFGGEVAVMVTYHAGQALILIGLLRSFS
jgi:uncharacterized membrane protein YhhN